MTTKTALKTGVDVFTLRQVFARAAALKELELEKETDRFFSKPIGKYVLDERLLEILAHRGIRHLPTPMSERLFVLEDENPAEHPPNISGRSNRWHFPLPDVGTHKFNLEITLAVGFHLSHDRHGVEFRPHAQGVHVSPGERMTNLRMFKVLVEDDANSSAFARELANAELFFVSWGDLGLLGVRSTCQLFREVFAHDSEAIVLANSSMSGEIFFPDPNPKHLDFGTTYFIPRPVQAKIAEVWRHELRAYRARVGS